MYMFTTCSYLVCADTSGSCFALALVRVAHDAFNLSQLLTVVNPELHEVEVHYKEQVMIVFENRA